MKSIAVLNISLGKYDVFWPEFYESFENLFCPDSSKTYFVFTDSLTIKTSGNVVRVDQDDWGWPFNTLYRYRMFFRILKELERFDYVIFMNGNSEVVDKISVDEFFGVNQALVAGLHSGYWAAKPSQFTTERRVKSKAFIRSPEKYYQGAINGGTASAFINAISKLIQMTEHDLNNGVMAVWHDESYWNAYIHGQMEMDKNKVHVLPPAYLYPEGQELSFKPKIILRDKSRYFDVINVKPEVAKKRLTFLEKFYKKFN